MRVSIVTAIVLILAVVHTDAFNVGKTPSQPATTQQSIFQKIMEFGNHLVSSQKDICKGMDCPKYEVKKTTDEYELRCYKTYKWAATVTEGRKPKGLIAFLRLFFYINGCNDQKKKMKMTVPLATKYEMAKGRKLKNRYTMHYFIPFENQDTPPKPTGSDVSIVTLPPMCVYVRSYQGYFRKAKQNLEKLKDALDKDKVTDYMDPKEEFFFATYDGPWKLWYRHNEIWIRQKSKQSAQ